MYLDSRKALQATRTGRDQKVVVKSKKTKQKKSFSVKPKKSKVYRGKPPKRPSKNKLTPFNRHFAKKRATKRQLMDKVKCYNYGKLGHFSKDCGSPKRDKSVQFAEPAEPPANSSPLKDLVFNGFSYKHVPP